MVLSASKRMPDFVVAAIMEFQSPNAYVNSISLYIIALTLMLYIIIFIAMAIWILLILRWNLRRSHDVSKYVIIMHNHFYSLENNVLY